MYIEKSNGRSTEPCGTPLETEADLGELVLPTTIYVLLAKSLVNNMLSILEKQLFPPLYCFSARVNLGGYNTYRQQLSVYAHVYNHLNAVIPT